MKHLKLLLFSLLIGVGALNVSKAYADEVTFTFSGYTDGDAIKEATIGAITVTPSKGTHKNNVPTFYNKGIRFYPGNTLTIKCSSGYKITKIAFSDEIFATPPTAGTLKNHQWTGEAGEIVFSSTTNTKKRETKTITVTYSSSSSQADTTQTDTTNDTTQTDTTQTDTTQTDTTTTTIYKGETGKTIVVGDVFSETFDKNEGTGGNDNEFSGSVATSDVIFENNSWKSKEAKGANYCVKAGTGSKLGSLTTPKLSKLNGRAILTFRAASWKGDNTKLVVSINGGGSLSETEFTLTNEEFNTFTTIITDGTANTTITFEGSNKSKQRFFLDDVNITSIKGDTVTLTITDAGFATYCGDKDLDLNKAPIKAYTAKVKNGKIHLKKQKQIKAGEGYLLRSVSGEAVTFKAPVTAGVKKVNDNDFKGYTTATTIAADMVGVYVLQKANDGDVEFFHKGNYEMTIPAGKAILISSEATGAKLMTVFDDETTAIATPLAPISNNNAAWYSLDGKKVSHNYKGIVIINGKKYIK